MSDLRLDAFLEGERCYLRPLRREDVDGPWARWLNDQEVTRYMTLGTWPATGESLEAYWREVAEGSSDDLVCAIVAREDDRHVGNIGLHRILWQHRRAELGIIIGERDRWGQGIGTEATRLVCAHGFARLNLHRVYLGVRADHAAAIRTYERVGFREEGRLREDTLSGGRYYDNILMGLLADELRQ